MNSGSTIRQFHTENFRVVVEALPEDDLDLSFDDSGDIARKLDNGDLIAFVAHAYVEHKDTGTILGEDYLGGCIYKDFDDFADHRACGRTNRRNLKRHGTFQVYRKARKYENILSNSDKLKKRGFATREKAEAWAEANASEAYEIFKSGKCGSYFTDMIHEAISEARKELETLKTVRVRKTDDSEQEEL